MVSLISIILNLLRKNKIIQVRRLPPRKVLRAHQLGLTLALLCAILAISLNFTTIFASFPLYISLLFLVLFALGTIWGGPFVMIVGLFLLFYDGTGGIWEALYFTAIFYIGGYTFGAIFTLLYNDLVLLNLITINKDKIKTVFAFDSKKTFNIIKSPNSEELTVPPEELNSDQMLYNYNLEKIPDHPYTIVFVANPKILKRKKSQDEEDVYLKDPIIKNRELFLRSIDRALFSFERNEVLGRPEIWSRIRIIALFDEDLINEDGSKYSLVQPSQDIPEIDGITIENLLDPRTELFDNFENMLKRVKNLSTEGIYKYMKETDVIFALSAFPEFDRSTAHYSDWIETEECFKITDISKITTLLSIPLTPEIQEKLKNIQNKIFIKGENLIKALEESLNIKITQETANDILDLDTVQFSGANPNIGAEGIEFTYNPDPELTKNDQIHKINFENNSQFKCIHEYYSKNPGRVALNVLGAQTKSYIHEFAHAMSSAFHGAIVDEYFDTIEIEGEQNCSIKGPHFHINRIERKKYINGKFVPVHKIFAEYNHVLYFSDLDHPSAEEEWIGYFPDRKSRYTTCIMDHTYRIDYCFDELISHFMYDRLITKINR